MGLASDIGDRFRAEFTGRVVKVLSGAILTVALARLLDPDGYGILYLALSVLGVVELFSKLGVENSAARYIANYKETDAGQLPHIIKFAFILNLAIIATVCTILLVAYQDLAILIGEPALGPLLGVGALFVAFGTLKSFVRSILQGFEAIKPAAVISGIDSVSRLIFGLGLVLLGYGAVGALAGYTLAHAIVAVLSLGYLYRHFYQGLVQSRIKIGIRRQIAEYAIPLTATKSAHVIDNRVDIILVGFFVGPIGVAYYTIGKQVTEFIETPIAALGFTLSPTYEVEKTKGNPDIAANLYEQALTHGLLLYIPAAAGIILVAEPLVELVFGDEYLGGVVVLQVLSIYLILRAINKLTVHGLDFLGRARIRAIAKGITSLLNVVLNVLFIPLMGVVGAAVATAITYSLYTLANVYIMQAELGLNLGYISRRVAIVLLITVAMSVVVYPLTGFISGFLTLFAVILVGVAVWGVIAVKSGLLNLEELLSIVT